MQRQSPHAKRECLRHINVRRRRGGKGIQRDKDTITERNVIYVYGLYTHTHIGLNIVYSGYSRIVKY